MTISKPKTSLEYREKERSTVNRPTPVVDNNSNTNPDSVDVRFGPNGVVKATPRVNADS